MRAFVVLGLFFSVLRQETGLGKCLRNGLFCVEWDVKPQLRQSTCCVFSHRYACTHALDGTRGMILGCPLRAWTLTALPLTSSLICLP